MFKDRLVEIFEDRFLIKKIAKKLPILFKIAEIKISRGGRVGMEIGVLREQIIIALLIYKFGHKDVITDIPTNMREIDVIVKGHSNPISIKTKTGSGFSGVKLIWTVDWEQVENFANSYKPQTDILFSQVVWDKKGIFAYIPLSVQREVLDVLTIEKYIKLPKRGTNPRGVEISSIALKECVLHDDTRKIFIDWKVSKDLDYNPYKEWVELWARD